MDIIDGKYIPAGANNLYVKITGSGGPAIVIETDWGGLSSEWAAIQEELSKETTVITYDRAGYGESPKGPRHRTGKQIVSELYHMLTNSGVKEPYLFIGHGAGGLYTQLYARQYPLDVAGMILVDSLTDEDYQFDELELPKWQQIASTASRMENLKKYPDMPKEKFKQIVVPMLGDLYKNLPEVYKSQLIEYQSDQTFYSTIVNEYEAREDTFSVMKYSGGKFPKVPVKILSRDYKVMMKITKEFGVPDKEAKIVEETWLRLQKALLKLTPDSDILLIRESTHSIHLSRPDAIIDAAQKLMGKIKARYAF